MEEMSKGQILNYNNCTGQEQKIKIKKKVSWNLPQTDTESDEEFSDEKRNCSPQKKKASNRNTQKKKPLNRNTQKKISLKKNAQKIDDNTKKKGKRKVTNTKAPSEKDITNVKTVNCNAMNLLSKAVQKIKPQQKNKKTKKTVSEKVKTDKKVNAKSASKVKKKLITDKEANAKQNSKSKPRKEKKELKVTVCSKPEIVLKKEIIDTDELDEGPSNNDKIVAIEDVADILRDADYMEKSESCSRNDDKIIISKDAVTEMDGVCDQEVSIISDSYSSSDFEDVEPLNVSPDTELKPSSSDTFDQSETSPDSAKKTEDKDKEVNMRQNKKGKNKKEKQELTKNEKVKEVSSNSTKRKKSNKRPEDSGPPVKKKKTDSKTNLGKRKTKSDTSERCKKAKLKKESNDEDVEEPIKTKKTKSEKDEKLKQRTTSRTKKKKKEGAGKSFSSKKGDVTFDDTDVTAVLLKMEGASMRQSTSTEEEHEGEDNSESEQSEIGGSEDEDWEEVADHHTSMRSQIPDQPIEITLPDTALRKRKKKKAFDWIAYVRRQLIRFQRDVQRDMHKVHLMCLMSWGMKQNSILNSEQISAQVLSLIPESIVPDQDTCDIGQLEAILQWFRELVVLGTEKVENETMTLVKTEHIEDALEERKVNSKRLMVAIFVIVLRMMSFNTRLILSFHPVPLRLAPDNKSKDGQKKNVDDQEEEEESPTKKEKKCSKTKLKTNTDKKKSSGKKNNSKKSAKDETSKKGCKYFKKDAKVKKSSSSAIKSTSTSSDSTDVDAETNSSEKERKTFSSKLSKKVRQSTSENSDNDSSEKRRTLRPKPAGRKTKKSDGRAVNSDESGYEDVSVSDNDSDFCDDEFFTKIRQKKLLKKNVKVKKQKSADSAAESSSSDIEENDQETKHSVKISKDKDKSVDDKNKFCDSWVEVYLPKEKRWLCVDCERNIVDKPDEIEKNISQPVHYVFAFSTDSSVKDVTSRYASDWMTHTRKLRADSDWLNKMLKPYRSSNVELDDQDDENMRNELIRKPLPKTVGEYKNHPLYVLKRHLLKFEALYPNSAVPVGYIRGEPVYARECVHTLHSRENWLKEGRSVKLGEEAYKMVKSRKYKVPKLDPDALDLELYGFWQTEIYVPPPVVDGKIPRNAYGNLELFQEWMLPTGTVQVKLPGLNRIARKLGVDCVPAMVGWDTHSGYSHPLMDGWIVCSEHEEALQAAWIEDQEIQLLKEVEKKHKRALANWRLLTRSLIIGDRLKKQFDLEQNPECEENTEEVKNGKKADDVQSSWPRNLEKKTQKTQKASKKKPRLCSVETI